MCIKRLWANVCSWTNEHENPIIGYGFALFIIFGIGLLWHTKSERRACLDALQQKGYSKIIVRKIKNDFDCSCEKLAVDKTFPKLYNNYLEGNYPKENN